MVIECAGNAVLRQYEQQVAHFKSNLSTELSKLPLRVVAPALQTPPSSTTTPGSVSAHTMHSVSEVYEADAVPIPGVHMSCASAGRAGSCKTTILQCCKFNSKQTQHACKGHLSIVTHKRGHLAVSCSTRHQWVWCPLCCNCNAGKGAVADGKRGCAVSTHWYERDAFDTGARNHMNTHTTVSK